MDAAAVPGTTLAPVALVADPDPAHGRRIGEVLRQEYYKVVECNDYQQLSESFAQTRPDVVFVTVMPSTTAGLTAIRDLKSDLGASFVPLVAVTSVADDWFLSKCLEAGCDDVLLKPVRSSMLRARLRAMEKAKVVHDEVRRRHQELRQLHSIVDRNQEIAAHVFSRVVMEENQAIDDLRLFLRPAARFSGDLLLTARSPSGALYVLLGDFTGHGLAAALGAVPASQIFRAMTAKGFGCKQIVQELNRKLHTLLPTGMFMAACLLRLDAGKSTVTIWNGGMPDVILLGEAGEVMCRFPSNHLPLGVQSHLDQVRLSHTPLVPEGRFLLVSDGLLEAVNPEGSRFGEAWYLEHLKRDDPFAAIVSSVEAFTRSAVQDDDISLVEVPCAAALQVQQPVAHQADRGEGQGRDAGWSYALELRASTLRDADPVPLIIGFICDQMGFTAHRQRLFMILSELYSNALEHGVLGLSSAVKQDADGYTEYYRERERRLQAVGGEAYVRLAVSLVPSAAGPELIIQVEDSGNGFDVERVSGGLLGNTAAHGRGIALVRTLADELSYEKGGTLARARCLLAAAPAADAAADGRKTG